jgi:hypothetical protein
LRVRSTMIAKHRPNKSGSSQHPVGQRNLADEAANQEAERERDDKFEQEVQRNCVEGRGKTHEAQREDKHRDRSIAGQFPCPGGHLRWKRSHFEACPFS